jgi:hypothetical protein
MQVGSPHVTCTAYVIAIAASEWKNGGAAVDGGAASSRTVCTFGSKLGEIRSL